MSRRPAKSRRPTPSRPRRSSSRPPVRRVAAAARLLAAIAARGRRRRRGRRDPVRDRVASASRRSPRPAWRSSIRMARSRSSTARAATASCTRRRARRSGSPPGRPTARAWPRSPRRPTAPRSRCSRPDRAARVTDGTVRLPERRAGAVLPVLDARRARDHVPDRQGAGSLALRSAPADGSAESTILREGDPMYWAWEDRDRMLVHTGAGHVAFLGAVGDRRQHRHDARRTAGRVPGAGGVRRRPVRGVRREQARRQLGRRRRGERRVGHATRPRSSAPSAFEFAPAAPQLAYLGAGRGRPPGAAAAGPAADRRRGDGRVRRSSRPTTSSRSSGRRTDRGSRRSASRRRPTPSSAAAPRRPLAAATARHRSRDGPDGGACPGRRRRGIDVALTVRGRRGRDGHAAAGRDPLAALRQPGAAVLRPVRAEPPRLVARRVVDPAPVVDEDGDRVAPRPAGRRLAGAGARPGLGGVLEPLRARAAGVIAGSEPAPEPARSRRRAARPATRCR